MAPRWQIAITPLVVLIAVSACILPASTPKNPANPTGEIPLQPESETVSSTHQPSVDTGWSKRGEAAKWPDYIPADIPPLQGKIRLVMEAPGSRVRIFYEDLTREQILQYLRLLEQKGFNLEYQVYVQEGFPDNSEERLKKGDYDAVDITKGDYHMNIGYGEGNISYDIYTTGFTEPIPTSAGLDWPADLVGVVPKPERCPIESAFPDSMGGYQIVCRPIDTSVKDDYLQALQVAGYLPRESAIVSPNGVYGKGDLDITVEQHSTALMLINLMRIDLSKSTWPSELTGIVPPPENCPIKHVLALEGLNFLISCEGESDQVVSDYITLLTSAGFVETSRMEMQPGSPVSVSLEKGDLEVQLLISSERNFAINISEKP